MHFTVFLDLPGKLPRSRAKTAIIIVWPLTVMIIIWGIMADKQTMENQI